MQIETCVEQNAGRWDKAVLDSSLGQIGTVGAMTIEECASKMK